MAKKVKIVIKLVIQAGKANPAPPVGSALGPQGVNLMQFCKDFNAQTATMTGSIPVVVTVYDDRTFEFILKTPAVSELIKQALKIQSGSKDPIKVKVGTLTDEQVTAIATKKMEDLNCYTIDQAKSMIIGTARSMGVKIAA
jgi:large subunit ribosomal protein L11